MIVGDEMRALRRLQREQEPKSPFVFTSERGTPFTTAGFSCIVGVGPGRSQAWLRTCSDTRAALHLPTKVGRRHEEIPVYSATVLCGGIAFSAPPIRGSRTSVWSA